MGIKRWLRELTAGVEEQRVLRALSGAPFFLVEVGHRAMIDLAGASTIITASQFSRCDGFARATASQARLLHGIDRDPTSTFGFSSGNGPLAATDELELIGA